MNSPSCPSRSLLLESLADAGPTATAPLSLALRARASGRDRLIRTEHLVAAVMVLDARMVRALLDVRAAGVSVAVLVATAASGPGTRDAVEERELLALASHGVPYVRLRAGDDLRTAFGVHPSPGMRAAAR